MVGTGKGAENGILIKGGEYLETAHRVKTVVLDKTGTITEGKPHVTDVSAPVPGFTEDDVLRIAASLERHSEHPLGQAIVAHAPPGGEGGYIKVRKFESVTGLGISAVSDSGDETVFHVGSPRFMEANQAKDAFGFAGICDGFSGDGKTPVCVAADGEIVGVIAVADIVKPTSREAVRTLKEMGIEVVMITGDNRRTAESVARQVGVDSVLSEVLPGEKAENVRRLQEGGRRVAMVGDGINDAPALALADVGIAIGAGTDVAMESANIVLMRGDLLGVSSAVRLSRKTMTNIRQNLFWAFVYNIMGIPIAMGVWHVFGGPLLNPMIAAAAMGASSVSVLSNALRLKRVKI